MLQNYIYTAIRGLCKNRLSTLLNITGLGMGLGAFCLVMLWVADERGFNTYNRNYDKVGLLYKHQSFNGTINTTESNSIPLAAALRASFGQFFDEVVVSSFGAERSIRYNDQTVIKRGYFYGKRRPRDPRFADSKGCAQLSARPQLLFC
jgi:putative ABC transport system permease protein